MKQINTIIQSSDEAHILTGGLNSLDETDYSEERWTDIVKVNVAWPRSARLCLSELSLIKLEIGTIYMENKIYYYVNFITQVLQTKATIDVIGVTLIIY